MRKLFLAIAAIVTFTGFWVRSEISSATTPEMAIRWEYAWLDEGPEQTIFDEPDHHFIAANSQPGTNPDADDKLASYLGGQLKSDRGTRLQLLNMIGSRGWELVAMDSQKDEYYFKRPIR